MHPPGLGANSKLAAPSFEPSLSSKVKSSNPYTCSRLELLLYVHPPGLEPGTTVPKTVVISISPRVHILNSEIIHLFQHISTCCTSNKVLIYSSARSGKYIHAGVVKWYNNCLPSSGREFDSPHPHILSKETAERFFCFKM